VTDSLNVAERSRVFFLPAGCDNRHATGATLQRDFTTFHQESREALACSAND